MVERRARDGCGGAERGTAVRARWRDQRDGLEDAGADPGVLAAIDPLVGDAHLLADRTFVAASGRKVLHLEPLSARVDPFTSWSNHPELSCVISDRQRRIPHVIAWIDHRGADIEQIMSGEATTPTATTAITVGAPGPRARRVHGGGWSQRRIEQRALKAEAETATAIAAATDEAAAEIDAALIVLVGDEALVSAAQKQLRSPAERWCLQGGRSADGSQPQVETGVGRLIATVAAERTRAVLEAFREDLAQGHAVETREPVENALASAQVQELLVADRLGDTTIDALVCKALTTGAGVRVVPTHGGPAEGVGAILRWP